MRRIILGASPAQATALLQEIQLRLGELRQDVGTGAATQYATAVGEPGSSTLAAPDSHVHPFAMASGGIVGAISTSTSTGGQSPYFSRGDHIHFFNFAGQYGNFASNVSLSTSTGGAHSQASRADHIHYLVPGTTAEVMSVGAVSDGGTQSHVARIDHVHKGATIATGTMACNISLSTSTAGVGPGLSFEDHMHYLIPGATANVQAVAAVADAGSMSTVARIDHVHVGAAAAGGYYAVVTKNASYAVTTADLVVVCDKASTMTIDLTSSTGSGKAFYIKSINSQVIVGGNGADTIDGAASQLLNQWDCIEIVDYATGYWAIV